MLNALVKIAKADGECKQVHFENWIEVQNWDWDVEAETSWTKGGGCSVGKPNPGKLNFEHYWDKSSAVILGYICTGCAFSEVKLIMFKRSGTGKPVEFFKATMYDAFVTKVAQNAVEDGNLVQKVELVFKKIEIQYSVQSETGRLTPSTEFSWDISTGKASPGAA
jgi:type VI secretion system secreted protein Hcp